MKKILLGVIALNVLCGCMEKNNPSIGSFSIPLENSVSIGMKKENSFLNSLKTSLVPLELTDSSILGDCYIVEDLGGKIIVCDYQNVYAFHNENGSFLSRLSHKGEGPEEYIGISDVAVCPKDESIVILDNMGKKVNTYSLSDGNMKNSIPNDTVVSFQLVKDDKWVAYNSPLSNAVYDICMYDTQWRLIKGIYKRKETLEHKGLVQINDFLHSNGEAYTYVNDTLYHISESGDVVPFCYMEKGALSMPNEIASDITQKSKRNNYIWGEQICFSEEYCFLRYYYDRKVYFDVWNLNSKELCYRNRIETASDKKGLPLKVGDETYFAWPKYVKDNIFYCIANSESEDGAEGNPFILKVKIK